MSEWHLAQMNLAQAVDGMESAAMAGFVARLDEINRLADSSPGFIWRLQDESGDATSIKSFEDPRLLVNMSVWQDLESLKYFVYKSAHVELIRDRDVWFNKLLSAHQVLWWVPAGEVPTVAEAQARLEHLREHGPSGAAFTFAKAFPPGHRVLYC
ncbi:MAG TPA: DUF3291 domain-containing protein [Oceanospirillaceae bacterium]|nr:DUF3291 domain-containing protein [Oceanospirillaceae bacterium]